MSSGDPAWNSSYPLGVHLSFKALSIKSVGHSGRVRECSVMAMVIHISGNVFDKISFLWTPCWVGFTLRNEQICEFCFALILDRGERGVKGRGVT